ncbi:MAG: Ig-like domain-containing protein, partial [Candidatus Hadarchaeales archaeon]
IAFTTPNINDERNYTIKVRAKAKGTTAYSVEKSVTLIVDGKAPTLAISTSKFWANANEDITITVTANEPLASLDNVRVKENNGDWIQLTMSPADTENKVWTGTYTTSDNAARDGQAIIQVWNASDLCGNKSNQDNWFMIDRTAPAAIKLSDVTGFPAVYSTTGKRITDNSHYTFTISIPYENSVLEPVNGDNVSSIQTVRIRVGTSTTDMALIGGLWTAEVNLPEGLTEIGFKVIDKAGNESPENADNVLVDLTPPSITIESPENGALLNDNTPTFRIIISDATLGIENRLGFSPVDNSGYTITLWSVTTGENLGWLRPVSYATLDNVFTWQAIKYWVFENTWSKGLDGNENKYRLVVEVGDNFRYENKWIEFTIDTVPPSKNDISILGWTGLIGSLTSPQMSTKTTWPISGTIPPKEVGGKLRIYVNGSLVSTIDLTSTSWTANVPLTPGTANMIELQLVDRAGNESDRLLYGYIQPDATAPTVTISSPATGTETDATAILVTGTVTKDPWESFSELTLTLQSTTGGAVTVPIGSDGSFSWSVALGEGLNSITVTAKDALGNVSAPATIQVTRRVTPWMTYAIILVIVALILAAIAIFRKK